MCHAPHTLYHNQNCLALFQAPYLQSNFTYKIIVHAFNKTLTQTEKIQRIDVSNSLVLRLLKYLLFHNIAEGNVIQVHTQQHLSHSFGELTFFCCCKHKSQLPLSCLLISDAQPSCLCSFIQQCHIAKPSYAQEFISCLHVYFPGLQPSLRLSFPKLSSYVYISLS